MNAIAAAGGAFAAAVAAVLALALGPGRAPPLPPPSAPARARWAEAAEQALPDGAVEIFAARGHLLVPAAVPAGLVEGLLLPELSGLSTPLWARLALPHLRDKFQAVRYGPSLHSAAARDFWASGPAARLVGPLLGGGRPPLLLADAYYELGAGSQGHPLHDDSLSSFCFTGASVAGISFWLALDDAPAEGRAGGIEVCDVPAGAARRGPPACTTYGAKRGDAVIFSRHAPHRSLPFDGRGGIRRALVGRLVPATARLGPGCASRLPDLVHLNGFDGPYLCDHGLHLGDALRRSSCFAQLGEESAWSGDRPRPRLQSPIWPLLRWAGARLVEPATGLELSQALALALTLIIELTVARVWWAVGTCTRKHPCGDGAIAFLLAACAAGSLLTHPCAWFWADVLFDDAPPALRVGAVEALVVLAEWGNLRCVAGDLVSFPLALSVAMNASSVYFGGLLVEALQMYGGRFSLLSTSVSWGLGGLLLSRLLGAA